jgi:hypothetical protein
VAVIALAIVMPARIAAARVRSNAMGKHELHDLLAEHLPADAVLGGIDTPDGPWVAALIATGYHVFAINPRQAARARDRHSMSCAKSDTGDAHVLADLVRIDAVLVRVHQTLI